MAYTVLKPDLTNVGLLTNTGSSPNQFWGDQITQAIAEQSDSLSSSDLTSDVSTKSLDLSGNTKKWVHTLDSMTVSTQSGAGAQIDTGYHLAYFDETSRHHYLMTVTQVKEDATARTKSVIGINTAAYDLNGIRPGAKIFDDTSGTLKNILSWVFANVPWNIKLITNNEEVYPFEVKEDDTAQAVLQAVVALFGVEVDAYIQPVTGPTSGGIIFGTSNAIKRVIEVNDEIGSDKAIPVIYGKNMTALTKTTVSDVFITRFKVVGADGLTIESVNNGSPYLVDDVANQAYNPIGAASGTYRDGTITNSAIKDSGALLTWGKTQMAQLNHPRSNYEVGAVFAEGIALGDSIVVQDLYASSAIVVKSRAIKIVSSQANPYALTVTIGEFVDYSRTSQKSLASIQVLISDAKNIANIANQTANTASSTANTAKQTADTASSTASLAKDAADKANEAAVLAAQQAAEAFAASDKLNTDLSKQINDNKEAADQSIAEAQAAIDSANTNLTAQINAANDAIIKAKTDLEKADVDIKQSITDTQQQVVDAQNAAVQSATDLANQAKADAISTAQTNAQKLVSDSSSVLNGKITDVSSTVDTLNGTIKNKVDQSVYDAKTGDLTTRLASAEQSLTGFTTTVSDMQNKVNALGQINNVVNSEFDDNFNGWYASPSWTSVTRVAGYNGSYGARLDASGAASDDTGYRYFDLEDKTPGQMVSVPSGAKTVSFRVMGYFESLASGAYVNGTATAFDDAGNSLGYMAASGNTFTSTVGSWQASNARYLNMAIPDGTKKIRINTYLRGQGVVILSQPMVVFDSPTVGTYVPGPLINAGRLTAAEQTIDGFKRVVADGNGNTYSDLTTALRSTQFFAGMDGTQSIRDQTSSQITDSVTNGSVRTALNLKADSATLASYALVTSVPVVTTGGTAPSSPKKGDVWVNTSVTPAANMTYSGSAWVQSGIKITTATSAPTSPAPVKGDVWVNTSKTPNQVMVYSGSTWVTTGDPDATAKGAALQVSVDKITGEVFDSAGKSIISQQADQIASKVSQTDFSTWKSTVDWTKVTTLNDLNTYITANRYLYAATTAVANQPVGGVFYFEVIAVSGAKIQQRVYKDNNPNSQWVRTSYDGTGSSWSAWEQIGTMSSVFTQTAGQIASTVSNEVMSSTWSQTKNGILTTAQNAAKGLKASFNVGSDGTITASVSDTQKGLSSTDLQTALMKTTLLSDADGNQSLIAQTKSSWTADIQSAKTGLQSQITAGDNGVLASVKTIQDQVNSMGQVNQLPNTEFSPDLAGWYASANLASGSYPQTNTLLAKSNLSYNGSNAVIIDRSSVAVDDASYSKMYSDLISVQGHTSVSWRMAGYVEQASANGNTYFNAIIDFFDSTGAVISGAGVSGGIFSKGVVGKWQLSTDVSATRFINVPVPTGAVTAGFKFYPKGQYKIHMAQPMVTFDEDSIGAYVTGSYVQSTATILGLFDNRFALGIQNNQGLITSGLFGDVNGMTLSGKTVTIDAGVTIIKNLDASKITTGSLTLGGDGAEFHFKTAFDGVSSFIVTGFNKNNFVASSFSGNVLIDSTSSNNNRVISTTGTIVPAKALKVATPKNGIVSLGNTTTKWNSRTFVDGVSFNTDLTYGPDTTAGYFGMQMGPTGLYGSANGNKTWSQFSLEADGTFNTTGAITVADSDLMPSNSVTISPTGISYKNDFDWKQVTPSSAFSLYSSSSPIEVKVQAGVVYIHGVLKPTDTIAGSANSTTMFSLPLNSYPHQTEYFVMQSTGTNRWLMTVSTTGDVGFSRYSNGTGYNDASNSVWLPFSASWAI